MFPNWLKVREAAGKNRSYRGRQQIHWLLCNGWIIYWYSYHVIPEALSLGELKSKCEDEQLTTLSDDDDTVTLHCVVNEQVSKRSICCFAIHSVRRSSSCSKEWFIFIIKSYKKYRKNVKTIGLIHS